ncbi:MAG: BTAD domain-containing putative transcriptional regulator [Gemmatimonadales bacterium]
MELSTPYRLETLGSLSLEGPSAAIRAADQRQQRRRLALLSTLACAGERGLSRDQLLLLFWPDSTQKKARHSLDQLLYAIRNSIDDSIFAGVNPLRLNQELITSDVGEFARELGAGNLRKAVALYGGPFLDGFYLSETREFEEWVALQRDRLAHRYCDALEKLARDAHGSGDHVAAVTWRRKLCESDPISTRNAAELMRALALSGDPAAAISHGEHYKRIYSQELGDGGIEAINQRIAELKARSEEVSAMSHFVVLERAQRDTPRRMISPPSRLALAGTALTMIVAAVATFAYTTGEQVPPKVPRARMTTMNVAAYDLYRRGIDPSLLRNDSTALIALGFLERAVQLDTTFAAGYAGLATMYQRMAMSNSTSLSLHELESLARGAAQRSIALDQSLAEGHATLGLIESFWGTDLSRAEQELNRALILDPTLVHTREYLANALLTLGRPDEALAQARLAAQENPVSPTARATVAQVLYVIGRCDDAMSSLDSLAALTPPLLRVAVTRSLCLSEKGRWSEAAEAIRNQAMRHHDLRSNGILAFALAKNGQRDEAIRIHHELITSAARDRWAYFYAAMVTFGLGDRDGAAQELKRAAGSTAVPYELLGPPFAALRQELSAEVALRANPFLVSFTSTTSSTNSKR